jgi:hypothetical protein
MKLPDGARTAWAIGWLVEMPQSVSGVTPDFQVWKANPGMGTPLIWYNDAALAWMYFGTEHPCAVSSDVLSPAWLDRLAADPSLASQLPGVFSLVVFDRRRDTLTVYGDRLGVQAVHLGEDAKGTWRMSTHLTWLLLAAGHDGSVNEAGFFSHMGFGYTVSGDDGVYDGVRKLPPSGYVRFGATGLQEGAYWTPPEPTEPLGAGQVEETVADLRAAIRSSLTGDRIFLGLTSGKDSLLLASLLPEGFRLRSGTFGHFESADQLQADQIQAVLGATHTQSPVCPAREFAAWAVHVSFQSGGLTTASYVDKAYFTGTHIPPGWPYVMGEGGECVRDFLGKEGKPPIQNLTEQYMTPIAYLRSALSSRLSGLLDDYPANLLSYSKTIAGQSDDEAFVFQFYRYQRMPGNFSLRHAVLSSLRPRLSPLLDPRFIDRNYALDTQYYRGAGFHRQLIAHARPSFLPFFDKPVVSPHSPQDWANRLRTGVGETLVQMIDEALPLCDDVFDPDGVRALGRATIEQPSRAMYLLFRIVSFAQARRFLRLDARERLAAIAITRPVAAEPDLAQLIP